MLSRRDIYNHLNLFIYNYLVKDTQSRVPNYAELPLEKITDMKDIVDHLFLDNNKTWHVKDITLRDLDFYKALSDVLNDYYTKHDSSVFWSNDRDTVMKKIINEALHKYDDAKISPEDHNYIPY